ncbi:MurR/RpiR family transcriptional regulator [Eubacterium sp.]|uniref:MurR/RpiR family transcriptional regulator n=1 Tax=Eubacterium sp. TaxID=142586 RepID=UPI002FCC90CF
MCGEIQFEIRKNYRRLRPSEKKVADYLLSFEGEIETMTIIDLAHGAGVSQPTVIRFASALGFQGFKELKYQLMKADGLEHQGLVPQPLHGFKISSRDRMEDVPSNIVATAITMLRDTLMKMETEDFVQLIEKIIKARRVFVFGVENSHSVVSDLVTKLLYLGIDCLSYGDYYLQSVCANNLGPEDLAIAISYSGYSRNTIDVLKIAKKSGAATAAITNFEKSLIKRYGDLCLTTSSEQYMYGNAIFSRVTQHALVDMVYTGVLLSRFEIHTQIMDNNSRIISDRAYESLEEQEDLM